MTPEEFAKIMQKIVDEDARDLEAMHWRMDMVMMELLRRLGYDKAMDIFEMAPKWYA